MSKPTIDQKLESKLASGLTVFTFRKANGEIRYAAGTTDNSLFDSSVANIVNKPGSKTIAFYDFLKKGVRSLKRDSIIRINTTVIK